MKDRNTGFTILELLLVVVIAGILLGIGVPAFGNFIRNARMTSAANDVMAALHYARSEAIKRRSAVTVCTSANPLDADPDCDDTDALTGWVVFVDNNGNGERDDTSFDDVDGDGTQDPPDEALDGNGVLDPGEDTDGDGNLDVAEATIPAEQILTQHAPLPGTITARGSVDPLRITYLDTGFAQAAAAGQLVLCDARGNVLSSGGVSAARGITIAATGRAGVTRDKDQIEELIDDIGGTIGGCGS